MCFHARVDAVDLALSVLNLPGITLNIIIPIYEPWVMVGPSNVWITRLIDSLRVAACNLILV